MEHQWPEEERDLEAEYNQMLEQGKIIEEQKSISFGFFSNCLSLQNTESYTSRNKRIKCKTDFLKHFLSDICPNFEHRKFDSYGIHYTLKQTQLAPLKRLIVMLMMFLLVPAYSEAILPR